MAPNFHLMESTAPPAEGQIQKTDHHFSVSIIRERPPVCQSEKKWKTFFLRFKKTKAHHLKTDLQAEHPEPLRIVNLFSILQCLPFGCHGNRTAAYRSVPKHLVQMGARNPPEGPKFSQKALGFPSGKFTSKLGSQSSGRQPFFLF